MFTTVRSTLITLAALATGCFVLGAAQSGLVHKLDAATKQQCLTEDWPAHQHEEHVAFCNTYLNN